MTFVLAIDPGNIESGWAVLDSNDCRPIAGGKCPNEELHAQIIELGASFPGLHVVIEMVEARGMTVGGTVFETVFWIGRYYERAWRCRYPVTRTYRRDVKKHLCGVTSAKDSNVTAALIERFAPNTGNRGKGTKADPGWFHGFRADQWQAYALGVHYADTIEDRL